MAVCRGTLAYQYQSFDSAFQEQLEILWTPPLKNDSSIPELPIWRRDRESVNQNVLRGTLKPRRLKVLIHHQEASKNNRT